LWDIEENELKKAQKEISSVNLEYDVVDVSNYKVVNSTVSNISKKSKISTLRRRLVSIGVVHKLKGHYLDTKHPIIVENLMGIRRVKGSIQKGKKPILINHLKSLINVINEQQIEDIKKFRDKS